MSQQRSLTPKLAAIALSAAALLTSPGCLAGGSSKTTIEGQHIGSDTIAMIEPGETDKAWIRATLGEPDEKVPINDDGGEIWKWRYRKVERDRGHFLFLFGGTDKDIHESTVYVEFEGDVVKRAWRD